MIIILESDNELERIERAVSEIKKIRTKKKVKPKKSV